MLRVEEPLCAVCVDMGTTNTRAWLVHGGEVLARAGIAVGARDTARSRSPKAVRTALRDLIAEVRAKKDDNRMPRASCVVAAGMITSPLGLVEVPHVRAPAGKSELAAKVERHQFSDVTDLPVWLVPGVRTGNAQHGLKDVGQTDVMRGEETLCVGLLALGLLRPGAILLNLGTHWKAILLDFRGDIASSITSMGGELLHVAQTETILAGAVPSGRPELLDGEWADAGMSEQRRSGLARALFCVRLLEQQGESTPQERLSFMLGAFVASELDALLKRGVFVAGAPMVISGAGAIATAWRRALNQASVGASVLSEAQVEEALLRGLIEIVSHSSAFGQVQFNSSSHYRKRED